MPRSPLTDARRRRTLDSNAIRRMIGWMVNEPAPHLRQDGLPSWWPFWEDCLRRNTRELVRRARLVAFEEGRGSDIV